jgi:hypothetical protein
MITRIELTNFMSHEHTVIEPAPGLTVLVGPNNCGKSAVVAALQILCKNPEAKFAIRHGAKECSVKVETDEGHTIVWRRKTAASYRLNDEQFDRLGRGGVPDSLHTLLRLPTVGDEKDDDFDIHFGAQKSPIFLLNSSAATAARFFASSSDASRLVEMQRRHKEKFADQQKQKNRLELESKQLVDELERLEPAVELDRRLQDLTEEYNRLQRFAESLEQAQRDVAALAEQIRTVARRQAEAESLRELAPPPALADLQPLITLRRDLGTAQQAVAKATAQSHALSKMEQPPVLFDVASLAQTSASLDELIRLTNRGEGLRAAFQPLAIPPTIAEVEPLARIIGQLTAAKREQCLADSRSAALQPLASPPELADAGLLAAAIATITSATARANREEQRMAVTAALRPPPAIVEYQPLRECVDNLGNAANVVADAEQREREAEQQLAEARASLYAYAATAVCPTCGSSLDAEQLVARAATGLKGHSHE